MTPATLEMTRSTGSRRIRASIDARTLKRVTNFFNGTALDIMTELFQNARRAGATSISVKTTQNGFTIVDDGNGIADPAVLLRFGGSEWDSGTIVREDAAGMGIYSLAGLETRITSRTQNRKSWTIDLGPEDYRGERTVKVQAPDQDALYKLDAKPGTVITVNWQNATGSAADYGCHDWKLWNQLRDDPHTGRNGATQSAARTAGQYLPIPVWLNGLPITREMYLEDVRRVHAWAGLKIGISRWSLEPRASEQRLAIGINVFGHIIKTDLPSLRSLEHMYQTRVEVVDCPDLKIVLPARKEVVQNDFFHQLEDACKKALLTQIADEQALTSFNVFQMGRRAGLEMVEPPIRLSEWSAPTNNSVCWHSPYKDPLRIDTAGVAETAIVVDEALQISERDGQVLAWVQQNARPSGRNTKPIRLMVADRQLAGYPGYDRLWQLTSMTITCVPRAGTDEVEPTFHPNLMSPATYSQETRKHPDHPPIVLPRAQSITLALEVERNAQNGAVAETQVLKYQAPFALPGEVPYSGGILLTEDAEKHLDVDALSCILFDAYYEENPSNLDEEMDPGEAQSCMRNWALSVLGNDDERRQEMLQDGILTTARAYAPHGRDTVVRLKWNETSTDFDVDVTFVPAGTETNNA